MCIGDQVVDLTVAPEPTQSLPQPAWVATRLREEALRRVRRWAKTYGPRHRPIALAYEYLVKRRRVVFPPDGSLPADGQPALTASPLTGPDAAARLLEATPAEREQVCVLLLLVSKK